MRRLLAAELRRLFLRRVVRGCFALVAVVALAAPVSAATNSSRDLGAAEVDAQRKEQAARSQVEASLRLCEANPDRFAGLDCDDLRVYRESLDRSAFYRDPRFVPALRTSQRVEERALALLLVVAVLGGALGGADWTSGVMANLLLWEPRRLRVLLAKLLAFAVLAACLMLTLLVVLVGGDLVVGATRGTLVGVDGSFMGGVMLPLALRGVLAAVLFSAVGLALGHALRGAVPALVVILSYLGAVEVLVRAKSSGFKPWLLLANAEALLNTRLVYFSRIGGGVVRHTLYSGQAAVFLGACALAVTAAAAVSITRRDVAVS